MLQELDLDAQERVERLAIARDLPARQLRGRGIGGGLHSVNLRLGASDAYTTVLGGIFNEAAYYGSTVTGGENKCASGRTSTVSGGSARTAAGEFDWVADSLFEDDQPSGDRRRAR